MSVLLAVPAALAQVRRVTDSSGRVVSLPVAVERVFAAGAPASTYLLAVAPDKMVGWTRALRAEEAAYLPDRYARLPELGRLTGRGNTANVEVVLQHRPDLIVDAGSLGATYASLADRVQEQTGIPYLLLDGSFPAIPQTLRMLGSVLGEEQGARQQAEYVERALADLGPRTAAIAPDKRPRFYYGRGPQGLETALGGSINVETLEFLGGRNVAGEHRGGLANVSMEQVLGWNPEIMFVADPNFHASVWNDARWQGVEAVRSRRVYLAPRLPFGWLDSPPGVNRVMGLFWAAAKLYPRHFGEDLRRRTREFYTLFYHREPTSAQLDALLTEPQPAPR